MKEDQINKLLEKYYKGETTLQEEALLKKELNKFSEMDADYEVFSYFEEEAKVPDSLEEKVFSSIQLKEKSRKNNLVRIIGISSVAAMLLVFFSVINTKEPVNNEKNFTDEQKFAILEEALTHVSASLQPEENNEVLIVYSDNNIEIVMN